MTVRSHRNFNGSRFFVIIGRAGAWVVTREGDLWKVQNATAYRDPGETFDCPLKALRRAQHAAHWG